MLLQSAPAVVAQSSVNEAAVWRESWQQRVAAAQRAIGLLNAVSDERTAAGKPQSGDAGQENLMSASPIAADPQQLLPLTPRSPGSIVFSSMRDHRT